MGLRSKLGRWQKAQGVMLHAFPVPPSRLTATLILQAGWLAVLLKWIKSVHGKIIIFGVGSPFKQILFLAWNFFTLALITSDDVKINIFLNNGHVLMLHTLQNSIISLSKWRKSEFSQLNKSWGGDRMAKGVMLHAFPVPPSRLTAPLILHAGWPEVLALFSSLE